MKKILSLVVSGIVASSLMVGCSNKETAKETVIIKYQDENGNVIKEKEVTKEEAQEIKEQNKVTNNNEMKEESKTNTKKETQEIKEQNKVTNNNEVKEESKTNTKKETQEIKEQNKVTNNNEVKEESKTNTKKETPKVEDKKEEASKFYNCDKCGKSVSNKNKEYFPYCYNCYIRIKKQVENMNKEDEEVKKEEPKEKEDDYKLDVNADEPKDKQIEIFQCNKCGGNAYYVDTLENKHCLSCERNNNNSDSGQEPLRDPENDIQE